MSRSIWDVLGITATTDLREIKRAFAARLRVTSPESDAAGYMELRDAFEAAKNHAVYSQLPDPDDIEQAEGQESAPPAPVELPASPQQQALEALGSLLQNHLLEDSLAKVEKIQAAQLFVTLDEQNNFIGEVALLVQKSGIEDIPWRGRLATLLGAREHDNIFPQFSHYWFAYEELLASFTEYRKSAIQAHADERFSTSPGYLHVYHVLTSPFDSERLGALTRSRNYHAIAEGIFERARTDPTIVIPAENSEWWERTAMAGQHRPEADATPPIEMRQEKSWNFPMWGVWLIIVVFLQGARYCGTHSSPASTNYGAVPRYADGTPMTIKQSTREVMIVSDPLQTRLESCDTQTRSLLLAQLRLTQPRESREADTPLTLDENDPVVASLLKNCRKTD